MIVEGRGGFVFRGRGEGRGKAVEGVEEKGDERGTDRLGGNWVFRRRDLASGLKDLICSSDVVFPKEVSGTTSSERSVVSVEVDVLRV